MAEGLSWAGPQQGNRAGSPAPSTQEQGRGESETALVLTHSGMCKEHPCPSTELPGSKGAAQLWQTPSNSSVSMVVLTMLRGQRAGDPCSIPFPGLLGPGEKHISHPAHKGLQTSTVSVWS